MTVHTPLRCSFSGMAAPDADGYVVLMDTGSYPSYASFLNQTWTFNGTDWHNTSATLMDPNGPLPGRSQMTFVYDGYSIMLYGGTNSAGQSLNDTWTWSGTAWTKQAPATAPFGRFGAKAATIVGGDTVMFGGFGGSGSGVYLLETWIWNGSANTWTLSPQANGASPAARIGHCMASNGTAALMFGGAISNGQFKNDTWSFNGTVWTQLAPTASPSVRGNACLAYDSVNSIYVLFGGMNEYNYLPETWTFNGTTWTQVAVPNGTGPAGRVGAQMCFDTQSGTTILFGGNSASDNYPSDATWSFNGSTLVWTKL